MMAAAPVSVIATFYETTMIAGLWARTIRMRAAMKSPSTAFSVSGSAAAFALRKPNNNFEVLK